MATKKVQKKKKTIWLPTSLSQELEKVAEEHPFYGNATQVIIQAIGEFLDKRKKREGHRGPE